MFVKPAKTAATAQSSSLCKECESTVKEIDTRIEMLKAKGLTVTFEVDGTKLDEACEDVKFDRIHWNVPHDGKDCQEQTLPPIIKSFFQSCRQVQKTGGRVHITLPQPNPAQGKSTSRKAFYQGFYYNIVEAASSGGYRILKKRIFNNSRYPEYQHMRTNQNEAAEVAEEGMREFVFERVATKVMYKIVKEAETDEKAKDDLDGLVFRKLTESSSKQCDVKVRCFYGSPRAYFECSTDEDSSDCEES
jgi:hypothetical protein